MSYRPGYTNLPNLARPAPIAKPASSPGARGAEATPIHKALNKGPKTKADPLTGLPKIQSPAAIRAEANAQAWKTIQQQQEALPSEQQIIAQYGARAANIAPIVAAHRNWLEQAGEYQVGMANGLASMVQAAGGAADATAGAGAAAAGAPPGATAPGGSVTPLAGSMPVAAYGTSTANYLHSLVPYADALGGQAVGQVNQDQNQALDDLRTARQKIAATLPQLQQDTYSSLSTTALNDFKTQLAARVAGQTSSAKTTSTAVTAAEKERHDRALEVTAARNATTSEERASAATKLANSKLTASGMTPAETKSLQSFLKDADKKYHAPGGARVPSRFTATLKLPSTKSAGGTTTPGDTKVIAADSVAEVQRLIKQFMAAHVPKLDPATGKPTAHWSQTTAVAPVKGSTKITGKAGEATRRLNAWRYLMAQNQTLTHPLSEGDLRAMFRSMEGPPPGSK